MAGSDFSYISYQGVGDEGNSNDRKHGWPSLHILVTWLWGFCVPSPTVSSGPSRPSWTSTGRAGFMWWTRCVSWPSAATFITGASRQAYVIPGVTKYTCIKSITVCVPSSELGLSQPLSRQRVCPPPPNQRGGGTLACGWGVGGVPIPTTGEKLSKVKERPPRRDIKWNAKAQVIIKRELYVSADQN